MDRNDYFPSGWSAIRDHFKGLCAFTANHGGHDKALCHDGGGGHQWRTPGQNNKFMCAGLTSPNVLKGSVEVCTKCESDYQYFKTPGEDYGACGNCHESCATCDERDGISCTKCESGAALSSVLDDREMSSLGMVAGSNFTRSLVTQEGQTQGYCLTCTPECARCTASPGATSSPCLLECCMVRNRYNA